MSVVVPAYNEEERLEIMLEEAVSFLDAEYGRLPSRSSKATKSSTGEIDKTGKGIGGYEILIVDDGSNDKADDGAMWGGLYTRIMKRPPRCRCLGSRPYRTIALGSKWLLVRTLAVLQQLKRGTAIPGQTNSPVGWARGCVPPTRGRVPCDGQIRKS